MALGTWLKRVVVLVAFKINLLTGHWKVYLMEGGAEVGAGAEVGVDMEEEEEETSARFDAFAQQKK